MRTATFVAFFIILSTSLSAQLITDIPIEYYEFDGAGNYYQYTIENNAKKEDIMRVVQPLGKYFNLDLAVYSYLRYYDNSIRKHTWLPLGVSISPFRNNRILPEIGIQTYMLGDSKTDFIDSYCSITAGLIAIKKDHELRGSYALNMSLVGGNRYFLHSANEDKNGWFIGIVAGVGTFMNKDVTDRERNRIYEHNYNYSQQVASLGNWIEFLEIHPGSTNAITEQMVVSSIDHSSEAEIEEFIVANRQYRKADPRLENALDDFVYKSITETSKPEAYYDYLDDFPEGRHVSLVSQTINRIESTAWDQAQDENTELSYQQFLGEFSRGKYASDAYSKLWDITYKSYSVQKTEAYIRSWPQSQHYEQAKIYLDSLNFNIAKSINTVSAYVTYSKNRLTDHFDAELMASGLYKLGTLNTETSSVINKALTRLYESLRRDSASIRANCFFRMDSDMGEYYIYVYNIGFEELRGTTITADKVQIHLSGEKQIEEFLDVSLTPSGKSLHTSLSYTLPNDSYNTKQLLEQVYYDSIGNGLDYLMITIEGGSTQIFHRAK